MKYSGTPLFVLILAVYLVASLACTSALAAEANANETRVAPPWTLTDTNGKKLAFSPVDDAGHRVLFFWATWCPYCKALMPHLERFRAARQAENFDFYALNIWEEGDAEAYTASTGFNFRLFLDADAVAKSYGIKGTPGLLLVNNRNEVLYERRSGTPPEQVITDLEFLLNNQR
ncbi:MAG: TlpA disulfide reductase family protein [Pseudomonadota bacterium]